MMDSDEEFLYESDSGNESSDDGFSSIIPVSEMGDNPVSDKNEDDLLEIDSMFLLNYN